MNEDKSSSEVILEWTSRPFEEERNRGIVGLIVILLFLIAVHLSFGSFFWVALSFVILALVVMPFYAPTKFKITGEGILASNLINRKFKSWDSLAGWEKDKRGVLLSPFKKKSFLDGYRGIYLRFNENGDEVMEIVKEKLENGRSPG